MVSDSELVTRLEEILPELDLDTATAAAVRRQLEEDFGVDLSDRKVFLRERIDIFIQTLRTGQRQEDEKGIEKAGDHSEAVDDDEGDEDVEDEDEGSGEERLEKEQKVKKKGGGFQKICSLSPQLQKLLGVTELARTEVVKRLWAYIKEHNLQDPKNKRIIVCDEALHAIFRLKRVNMFRMNKALSKHIWPLTAEMENGMLGMGGEANDSSTSELAGDCKGGNEGKDVEQETEDGEEEEKEEVVEHDDDDDDDGNNIPGRSVRLSKVDKEVKKRKGGFSRLCRLSPRLQVFIGKPELARTEVIKRLWAYIRENNLQNPKNKRKILCDDALRDLFRVNSIDMFQMSKALSKHIWPLSDDEGQYEGKPEETQQKKRCSGFLSPLQLSDALVKFLGTGEEVLSRPDVVKRIWNHIKDNDLQDPSNRKTVLCDHKLKELFEVESFKGFSVTKLLTPHLIKMEQDKSKGTAFGVFSGVEENSSFVGEK